MRKKINTRELDPHTRFISAALEGNFATMRKTLTNGHNINSANEDGETAFSWCCQYNKLRAAQFLYANGADINLPLTGAATPLDIAVYWASPTFQNWLKSIGGIRKKEISTTPKSLKT